MEIMNSLELKFHIHSEEDDLNVYPTGRMGGSYDREEERSTGSGGDVIETGGWLTEREREREKERFNH